ncbi:hypothetical protein [Paraburkholderia phenoliruptrix]|uniref:hypothetical protein n=1 Tax=Paraburkholderia phenoliruptrix TaxID=252970 RepID=UPI0034CED14A
MSETADFQPGDDATINAKTFPELLLNGMPVVVAGPAQMTVVLDPVARKLVAVTGYPVTTRTDGRRYVVAARDLLVRPCRRDRDTVVAWKDCAWMPQEYRA